MISASSGSCCASTTTDRFEYSNLRFGEHSHLTIVKLLVSAQGKMSDPELMGMGDQPALPSDSVSDRIYA